MSCSPGWLSMYANASSQRLRVGFRDALVTVSVSAPTAYERVQNMQYVGHTEVAVSSSVPYSAIRGKKKKANTGQPTQEQRLVRVSVDETLDRRVGFLMQRIKHQLRVVRHHDRLHREELPNDRVVSWVIPVDPAQDVRAVECQRANMTEYRAGAVSHVIRMAMVAAVTPSKTSLMNSSRLCVVVPRVSNGTSAGTTACRNFRSFGAPWTVFATWVSKEHQLEFSPRLSKHARRTLQR